MRIDPTNMLDLDDFQHDEFKGGCFFEKDMEACEKDWKEMQHVRRLLNVQHKLQDLIQDYEKGHHQPETYDMAEIF